MNNNDIFKKLRVALMLRDEQIVEILELVDFRMSKAEIGGFFRAENHPNFRECGDQVLRNFLNGLVIFLRGTKDKPTNPNVVLEGIKKTFIPKEKTEKKPILNTENAPKIAKKPTKKPFLKNTKKPVIVEKVNYKNGKKK